MQDARSRTWFTVLYSSYTLFTICPRLMQCQTLRRNVYIYVYVCVYKTTELYTFFNMLN